MTKLIPLFMIGIMALFVVPVSALSFWDFLNPPQAAFIDFTVPFDYEKTVTTSARCSNKAAIGVSNPTNAVVESADVIIQITRVDNPINNMHIGKTRQTTAEVIQSSDCDVFNSACTGSPVTAFRSPAWSDLGAGIDGTCSHTFNVKFKRTDVSLPVLPPQQPPQSARPPERVFILSDMIDIFRAALVTIQEFMSRAFV